MPDSSALVQLIYRSRCAANTEQTALEGLANLVQPAAKTGGLTGILVLFGSEFVGIIEGKETRVISAMERVSSDDRHSGLTVLREAPIAERRFESWSWHRMEGDDGGASNIGLANLFAERLSRALYTKV